MSDDWPILQSKPGPTDSDIEFQNDLAYMRALVEDVIDRIIERQMPR
jgi:hypothetical protein